MAARNSKQVLPRSLIPKVELPVSVSTMNLSGAMLRRHRNRRVAVIGMTSESYSGLL